MAENRPMIEEGAIRSVPLQMLLDFKEIAFLFKNDRNKHLKSN
jgi:hypothetical protein